MHRTSAGFTLIEAIVATGLLVVVALGTAQLLTLAISTNLAARQQLVMSIVAARTIDELAAAAAGGALPTTPGNALDTSIAGCSDTTVEAGRTYVRRWRIAEVPGAGGEALAISVRIAPAEPGGGEVRFATIRRAGVP